jgi:hypothetical protein
MNTYPITYINKDKELKTIQEILKNNNYQQQIIHLTPKQNLTPKNPQKVTKNKMGHLHILWP